MIDQEKQQHFYELVTLLETLKHQGHISFHWTDGDKLHHISTMLHLWRVKHSMEWFDKTTVTLYTDFEKEAPYGHL